MSTQVQYRRGTATENNAFTGALAEITVDTTNWTLRVHDGVTVGGGGNLATVSYVTTQLAALSANAITFGTSNVQIPESNGNVRVNVGGTSNVAVFATTGVSVTGVISASGNITGSNINLTGNIVDTGALSIITGASGAIALAPNGSNVIVAATTGANVTGFMTASGNVTGGNLISTGTITTAGNIVSSATNATANIGSATTYFNTVHAKATSAQYADVAEYYASDTSYEPGTVVVFGGSNEITISTQNSDDRVAGVVSTNPAYIMNAGLQCEHAVAVALSGRVPTRVIGPVTKGNMMVSAGNGYAQACATPAVGTVIGKALENFSGTTGVIEVVVGRM